MMQDRWDRTIALMVSTRERIQGLDRRGLWTYQGPEPGATEDRLRDAEVQIGQPLPPDFRSFLGHAAGWNAVYQHVDMFGPEDLYEGAKYVSGQQMLAAIEERALQSSRTERTALIPIAASQNDLDLFVLVRRGEPAGGSIIWFAGTEIDRFGGFEEFFLSMLEYNRLEIQTLGGGSEVAS